ncbi:RNA pseudouridylate synthase domain-containing protein 2 [Frankliniella fusca]|uniref:Pseudouridylate synthase RPUSD2 n=1 Tax=Frankliniella fusca TaxID=407009 RepID=A0AAE1I0M7_9NEOP|nr:RNA pseudouridylate synthase domain-containing protein 2 [Frankliniella fusca]
MTVMKLMCLGGRASYRHETPVLAKRIRLVHVDEDIVALDKPCSLPVHPCGRYRHNTVVFILAKEYNLKNLRTIHRLDRLTSGLLLFGRSPKKARQMEHQIRNRQVAKEYVCRVEGDFPEEEITCTEPIEVVSYKIGVCKVSSRGKECATSFKKLGFNPRTNTSVVLCKPHTGRMHQIRVHLQFLGFPVVNDPLYNHVVFGPNKGKGGLIGKADDELIRDLVNIHNAENWLGMDGDTDLSMFKPLGEPLGEPLGGPLGEPLGRELDEDKGDEDDGEVSREPSPCGSCEDTPGTSFTNNNSTTLNNNIVGSLVNHGASTSVSTSTMASTSTSMASPSGSASSAASGAGAGGGTGGNKVTVATQTGHESPDLAFQQDKMTHDPHCYECKVRYRDPKPRDLIMYLHAWKFRGPDWSYETELPEWSKVDWCEPDD